MLYLEIKIYVLLNLYEENPWDRPAIISVVVDLCLNIRVATSAEFK